MSIPVFLGRADFCAHRLLQFVEREQLEEVVLEAVVEFITILRVVGLELHHRDHERFFGEVGQAVRHRQRGVGVHDHHAEQTPHQLQGARAVVVGVVPEGVGGTGRVR